MNKFVGLLAQGNPSIIELLGNDPELYVNMTPEGQMLLDNRELFLTRRIAYSYGGFANDQLRRLQMGLLRNGASPEAFKNKFEKRSWNGRLPDGARMTFLKFPSVRIQMKKANIRS